MVNEQYRLMFSELERFVIAHSSNSGRHYQVLECLMQVKGDSLYHFDCDIIDSPQVRNKPMPVKREAESEMSMATRELDR